MSLLFKLYLRKLCFCFLIIIIYNFIFQVMLKFLLLFIPLFFSFVYTFYRILGINYCVLEYTTLASSVYNTILVMLNMVSPQKLVENDDFKLMATHVTFIFMIPIMLLNFLIGLMSTEVSALLRNSELGMRLARVSVSAIIEGRLSPICGWYYQWQRRRCFYIEKDKVYVQCLVDL